MNYDDIIFDNLKCPICLEIFNEPKTLKCQHVLCLKCLNELLLIHKRFECPECRCVIENQSANSYPTNLAIKRILESIHKCFKCKKILTQNSTDCFECNRKYCTNCKLVHWNEMNFKVAREVEVQRESLLKLLNDFSEHKKNKKLDTNKSNNFNADKNDDIMEEKLITELSNFDQIDKILNENYFNNDIIIKNEQHIRELEENIKKFNKKQNESLKDLSVKL
jgi:hypothetical protein